MAYFGNPYQGVTGSANFQLNGASQLPGVFFVNPHTGTLNVVLMQWKTQGAYGGGTLGAYTLSLYATDANGFPTGAAILADVGWTPAAVDGGQTWTLSTPQAITAGNKYVVTIANTDADPSTNWASINTAQTEPAGANLTAPYLAQDTISGYFSGSFGGRLCYYTGGAWQWWMSTINPYYASGNTGDGSISPLQLQFADGQKHGHPYYSASLTNRFIYGAIWGQQLIGAWPHQSVTATGLLAPWGTFDGTPADSLYYTVIETAGGTTIASGTFSAPFAPLASLSGGTTEPRRVWITATFSSPINLIQGAGYRIVWSSPDSVVGACWAQTPIYGAGGAEMTSWGYQNSWGGSGSRAQKSANSGASWDDFESNLGEYALVLEGSTMASPITVYPNANDSVGILTLVPNTGEAAWEDVDEVTHDDATTTVDTLTDYTMFNDSTFTTPSPGIPAGATNISVTVSGWFLGSVSGTTQDHVARTIIKSGATLGYGAINNPHAVWVNYSDAFLNDPATGLPWTAAAANAATIGFRLRKGWDGETAYRTYATQIQATWSWSNPFLPGCIC